MRIADRIAVIADGKVTELGSHEELLKAGGRYASCSSCRRRGTSSLQLHGDVLGAQTPMTVGCCGKWLANRSPIVSRAEVGAGDPD